MSLPPLPPLSLLETRILGVLVEKQRTVPDSYPLSLNGLLTGCNQKTARDPVIEATEAEVLAALDQLRGYSLVIESSGGRVTRYMHNMERVLQVPSQSVAILAVLMLRGPQTPAEIRANTERLHRFSDVSTVEAFLAELSERSAGALVVELPRMPGTRENRWAHLLSGPPALPAMTAGEVAAAAVPVGPGTLALEARIAALEGEVAALRAALDKVCSELGITP